MYKGGLPAARIVLLAAYAPANTTPGNLIASRQHPEFNKPASARYFYTFKARIHFTR
jgi:hypothetical protein